MEIGWVLYYTACAVLWIGLAVLTAWSLRPSLAAWLTAHPRAMAWLLGLDRLPEDAPRVLRRFYLHLTGGWTWLLVWAWWLLPWFKTRFYRGAATLQSYQMARTATVVMLIATAVFGFYGIAKAILIWQRELHRRGG